MVASIMHMRERLTAESNRMGGHVASGSSSTSSKTKTSRSREDSSTTTVGTSAATSRTCEGCNRPNHSRESFRLRFHPDFNREGPWDGSLVERAIRVWNQQPDVQLPWKQRADGTPWNESALAPNPPKKKDKDKPRDKDYYGSNDSDRRGNDGGGKRGGGRVHFNNRRPCPQRYALSHRHRHLLDMKLRWV